MANRLRFGRLWRERMKPSIRCHGVTVSNVTRVLCQSDGASRDEGPRGGLRQAYIAGGLKILRSLYLAGRSFHDRQGFDASRSSLDDPGNSLDVPGHVAMYELSIEIDTELSEVREFLQRPEGLDPSCFDRDFEFEWVD